MELPGCRYTAIELCFKAKTERRIDVADIKKSLASKKFVWLDISVDDFAVAMPSLRSLELIREDTLEDAEKGIVTTQCKRYENHLNLIIADAGFQDSDFVSKRVDVIAGDRYIITLHLGEVEFLTDVRNSFSEDFRLHASTPSFLLYEIWDSLIDHYIRVQNTFQQRVESIQNQLFQAVGDEVFTDVAELVSDLLEFRKVLLPARSVLTELSMRKSKFVSAATQPYLANMVGSIETVLQDLLVERDILSESLHLYMSMVGHRTNAVMGKLTLVSVIFLPLTFLVGVYGMNFETIPELSWKHGYLYFWAVALAIVLLGTFLMRRNKFL